MVLPSEWTCGYTTAALTIYWRVSRQVPIVMLSEVKGNRMARIHINREADKGEKEGTRDNNTDHLREEYWQLIFTHLSPDSPLGSLKWISPADLLWAFVSRLFLLAPPSAGIEVSCGQHFSSLS
ncbi:hypothetical protein AAFF_G00081430 [Aldrovandia affinis]|uniref:Uncharacterized protein n=1 Tax=Aldrovandia affinis TaxID=143900 RepID=A0AAD7WXV5_9TELE|nr:hypothetical protein AAFF_G00081430 [Aldrovandia affinis]